MELPKRFDYGVNAFDKTPGAKEKAEQILMAVQGLEIDTAVSLINWCARKLLEQKCEISSAFLQAALE